jgi:large subunit ribosomal protein L30
VLIVDKELKIKLIRSPIGKTKNQKLTLKALGLRKINQVVVQKSNDAILGMVKKVKHLIAIVE